MTEQMFMIVRPLDPADPHAESIAIQMGAGTLSITPEQAWRKHTRDGDPFKVQAWFDRGWRVRRVEVALLPVEPTHD